MSLHTRVLIVCTVAISAAGCATSEDMAQARVNRIASLRDTCESYGFQPGTDTFAQCVQTADNQRRAEDRKRYEAQQCMFHGPDCPTRQTAPALTLQIPQTTQCAPNVANGGLTCTTQ